MPYPKPAPLATYQYVLPYASQLFGVYQPILGLRSNSGKARVNRAAQSAVKHVITALASNTRVQASHKGTPRAISPVEHFPGGLPSWLGDEAAGHAHQAVTQIRQHARREPTAAELLSIVHAASAHAASVHATSAHATSAHAASGHAHAGHDGGRPPIPPGAHPSPHPAPPTHAVHEAIVAGTLQHLAQHAPAVLNALLKGAPRSSPTALAPYMDPLSHFSPVHQAAVLSPLAMIEIYREYFFELDSFLGPPVGHVWVSPGGSLEVYEVHTRVTSQTRTTSQSTDTTQSTEKTTSQQDDLSSQISHDSSQNMSVGVQAHAGVNMGVWQAGVSASLNMGSTQKSSQQTASKQTRAQSEKVSSQIRTSFKTSFTTTLSQTDTNSRRYVLSNNTDSLVNYELRRKMRKVGVQVQYVSTQLCWQLFIDHPGDGLGNAELVHLNQPADLSSMQPPTAPPAPLPQTSTFQATVPFEGVGGHNNTGDDYVNGHSHDFFSGDHYIVADKTFVVTPPAAGYVLQQVTLGTMTPSDPSKSSAYATPSFVTHPSSFDLHLDEVNFNDSPSLVFNLNLTWAPSPSLIQQQQQTYNAAMAQFQWQEAQAVHAAYVNAVRDRIKVMGQVAKRDPDDLRSEERSVIYQSILSQLMPISHDPGADDAIVQHVTSEMIRSIFDVDSMLYYVSPDWWSPKLPRDKARPHPHAGIHGAHPAHPHPSAGAPGAHPAHPTHPGAHPAHPTHPSAHPAHPGAHRRAAPHATQHAPAGSLDDAPPGVAAEPLTSNDLVTWNGKKPRGANDYQITEESAPAPMGASLGWSMQLDGDDRRNAFLNSPWVKAVLPIIPGQEMAALSWLIQDHVEGTDGLDDIYVPPPASSTTDPELDLQGKTIREVLRILATKVQATNTAISANPPDSQAVYESGFDPLEGGFNASPVPGAMFDQWVEVLPTDQVVAMEYKPVGP